MIKLVRVLLPAILVLGFSATAAAQEDPGGHGDIQYVYVDPNWDQMGGGSANVTSCEAYRQFGGYCVDCTISVNPRPGQKPACTAVEYSASCNCDAGKCSAGTTGATSGWCTYHR
jgi:hypothetical protein